MVNVTSRPLYLLERTPPHTIRGSVGPRDGTDVCVCCACCQVDVSATDRSLIQRSPTECGVSECDRKASTVRRPRPPQGAVEPLEKKSYCYSKPRGTHGKSKTPAVSYWFRLCSFHRCRSSCIYAKAVSGTCYLNLS
jgi:hypothetical protein